MGTSTSYAPGAKEHVQLATLYDRDVDLQVVVPITGGRLAVDLRTGWGAQVVGVWLALAQVGSGRSGPEWSHSHLTGEHKGKEREGVTA